MPASDALHTHLITWFIHNREALPWRQSRDPYRVWVSEIMLQQTQIATVVPYFERFVERFPDIRSLAAAPLDDVLKRWEGLGYYSRARNLHRAAQMVVREFDGQVPSTVEDLLKLPGIGRYTAGAIASLAFGQDTPVLDGNVMRVLARLFGIEQDIGLSQTRRALWKLAEELLPAGRAAIWNEALMELGQRICLPRSPECSRCPVMKLCAAKRLDRQAELPIKAARGKIPHREVAAGVIYGADGRILIAKRRPQDMLGGLWEFPGGKREPGESLAECVAREITEELAVEVEVGAQIAVVRHAYTHFRITLYVFACRYVRGEPQALGCAEWAWINLDDLDRYAFPRADRHIIAALRNGSQMGFLS